MADTSLPNGGDYSEDHSGQFSGAPTTSTFVTTPGNVAQVTPNSQTDADVVNFKPYVAPPKQFNPADTLGEAPPLAGPGESEQAHKEAFERSQQWFETAKNMTDRFNETQKNVDTGDFMVAHAAADKTSPGYGDAVTALWAKYPHADPKILAESLASGNRVNERYMGAVSEGGIAQAQSPEELQAYTSTMHATKDPEQAQAALMTTRKGLATLSEGKRQGVFSAEEDLPPWNAYTAKDEAADPTHKAGEYNPNVDWSEPDSKDRPKIYNVDGTINYDEGKKMIDERLGKISGKAIKADEADKKIALGNAHQTVMDARKKNTAPLDEVNDPLHTMKGGYDPTNPNHVAYRNKWWDAKKLIEGQPNTPPNTPPTTTGTRTQSFDAGL
jgi:hypothetical protein